MGGDKVHHPIFARVYARGSEVAERRGGAAHRRRLVSSLSGRVLEIGAGNGLTFRHYPPTVAEVIAVEPEAHLRELAQRAAGEAPVPVRVVDGIADALPADDESVDAVVVSLVLCSVPDQARALAEIRRVLRPGGELRFYEHVVARRAPVAQLMRLADATVWPRIAGGCHCGRDTAAAIGAAGFAIEQLERFHFAQGALVPAVPHILGTARAPE
jgi:ubiquinone/menaquinone biosynthesis C-methylase UbiE